MDTTAKFKKGDSVYYPSGTGMVDSVIPDTGKGFTYKVKCDRTGEILDDNFKESELVPHD